MSTLPKRVMLKISGEMLGGVPGHGIDPASIERIAEEIASVHHAGYEIAVVIGGGNIFRGSQVGSLCMDRAAADYMGMLATCINGLALQEVIENKCGLRTRVMTAIHMPELAEPYIRRKAIKHLMEKRVVIFAGGTGNPLFTTDTAASLRAREVGADMIYKATKVDGIYDCDPKKNVNARKFDELTYLDVISKNLQVMDATAITMCMDVNMPIKVFQLGEKGSVLRAITDPTVGTTVR